VFDNLSAGHRAAVPGEFEASASRAGFRLVVADLRDIDTLDHVLIANRIEAVMHFAAFTSVSESVAEPAKYYTNNLIYSLQLLERCRRNGISKFVFSSTAAVYGVPTSSPITEATALAPVNPYGNTKVAIERALADYAAASSVGRTPNSFGFCSLRYFNAAGAAPDGSIGEDHDPETHLIPLVIQAAMGKRPHVEIFGTNYPTPDGTGVRDYVHVDDLANAHILALEKIVAGSRLVYNVGIGKGSSVRQVIAAVEEVSGNAVPVKESPRRAGDPAELVANADKIRAELGWVPKYTELRAIIETAWNWHRTHPNGYDG
jgi:UDP-glucose-4-epimerase GalE